MLAIVSDTHGDTDHRLDGRTREVVVDADVVVHAGDFTTRAVYDAFDRLSSRLVAVQGNSDEGALCRALPETTTVDALGIRIAVAHGHRRDATALSLLARETGADLVIVGHSHRPGVDRRGPVPILNPGSHADPRRYTAAHAELDREDGHVVARIVTPAGETLEQLALAGQK